ncbi:tRNA (adenosine(37)-N6)-dimethylallyltransferase MiaA [Sporosalibacterium faouarense]|uniref:tRNA (adenosine(37)-N6)-dimethylallyltransferase MiaA n=1 Tax=Sporosalibacterium faouarense TaxID=516123 RepID=UPI00141C83B1|nr:tRNA (adenosine(37)-N6)-dimethylallyltransferase MiaA [Sporosalibacterium faouarense]MTI48129.1 tRNA (adenosine(37)-N6)-dimethylallyltransferase MiaA [Bacillota bacterium]
MSGKIPLLVLIGPTAVGKTSTSIKVAQNLNGEIISADSMQIYEYMDIGTAKVTEDEMENIEHYMVGEILPDEDFSVSDFQDKANEYIEKIYSKGKLPMVVGGTGLYINSLVYNLDFTNAVSNPQLREEYLNEAEIHGNEVLVKKLKKIDPESAERIHINDTKRLVRALEIYHETGNPMSKYYKNFRQPNDDYNIVMIGLNMDRKKLYDRINKRVDIMLESGLIDEVKSLLDKGYDKNLTSLQGLGYKEIISYLNGEYTYDEAIEILKRDSRRFAKRQLTWFRRDKRIKWVMVDEFDSQGEIVKEITEYVEKKLELE